MESGLRDAVVSWVFCGGSEFLGLLRRGRTFSGFRDAESSIPFSFNFKGVVSFLSRESERFLFLYVRLGLTVTTRVE